MLAALITVHLLAGGFWVGALAPLHQVAATPEGAVVLHRFGKIASGTVLLLIAVGAAFAWIMIGSVEGLISTAYGQVFFIKLIGVAGLLALAAMNKWRCVPALAAGHADAPARLRRSIRWEGAMVSLILTATAVLTSVTTPPGNL